MTKYPTQESAPLRAYIDRFGEPPPMALLREFTADEVDAIATTAIDRGFPISADDVLGYQSDSAISESTTVA